SRCARAAHARSGPMIGAVSALKLVLAAGLLPLAVAGGPGELGAARAAAQGAGRFERAVATQAATQVRLRVLGDAFVCPDARFVSYRRSDAEPEVVDQWYVASQLWADAELLLAVARERIAPRITQIPAGSGRPLPGGWDEPETRCHLDKGFIFLDRLWDYESAGYFPRSNPVGTDVSRGPRYADDNALAGLALLAAAEAAPAGPSRQRYLHAARREAEFLTDSGPWAESGLWDDTFGGGFWWNTGKGDTAEGKPAQTNAIAALFFARLYEATGDEAHRDWALRTLRWLDTVLYDPSRELYRWSVGYEDPENQLGAVVHGRYFNYDQAIALEAQILAARLADDPGRLSRARAIGRALPPAFWNEARGGYNLEVGVDQVYTSYSAWTGLGHLALYDLDGDTRWFELARENADALAAVLRGTDGSYAYRYYRCVDRVAPGCESGEVTWVVDPTLDTSAQAWAQHLETALGARGVPRHPPRGE
ncbi:MAG: AGE family epimerase/isomerase, partial [Chloroflexota bacterium]|nr:AGE family epimerase/isomerase [Chloroflexota bacterium]